jgi:hypothetical protein
MGMQITEQVHGSDNSGTGIYLSPFELELHSFYIKHT